MEKTYCPISHFLARFVEPVERPYFCFVEGLTSVLTDGMAMGEAESSRREIAVGFSG